MFEWYDMTTKTKDFNFNIGDVLMIKDDNKRRENREIGIVEKIFQEKDQKIRFVKMKTAKCYIKVNETAYTA